MESVKIVGSMPNAEEITPLTPLLIVSKKAILELILITPEHDEVIAIGVGLMPDKIPGIMVTTTQEGLDSHFLRCPYVLMSKEASDEIDRLVAEQATKQ